MKKGIDIVSTVVDYSLLDYYLINGIRHTESLYKFDSVKQMLKQYPELKNVVLEINEMWESSDYGYNKFDTLYLENKKQNCIYSLDGETAYDISQYIYLEEENQE